MDIIPTYAIAVRTSNSLYLFGKANKEGVRTVSRKSKIHIPHNKSFGKCRITNLAKGQYLEFREADGKNEVWYCSEILSIRKKGRK